MFCLKKKKKKVTKVVLRLTTLKKEIKCKPGRITNEDKDKD